MFALLGRFWRSDDGAVAPTIGLALFGLIAAGGVAIDYSRMAALDTELQNAADQAALAAAGQLDGQTGAQTRATAAAQNLVTNLTYFANDGGGTNLTIEAPEYYSSYDPNRADITDPPGTTTTDDEDSDYVRVTVAARRAQYALTPIIALIESPEMTARAMAGLGSAICNTPPVMICNPAETSTNTDINLPFNAAPGTGLLLIAGNADAPGNFGFLETGFGSGAQDLARALGYNAPPGECAPINGVTTKPGLSASVMAAVNTRFDVSENGGNTCPAGGTCSPSINSRKDLVRGAGCGITGQGWDEPPNPYRPTSPTVPLSSNYPDTMGHPRDMCHATQLNGQCAGGRIGTGLWDRDAYFRVNYGWTTAAAWQTGTGLSATATRYEVYLWEIANPSGQGAGGNQGINVPQSVGSRTGYGAPVCRAPGITPGGTNVDRRRISAAVINCEAQNLNGQETGVHVAHWLDLFLVEPSISRGNGGNQRTRAAEVYTEVIQTTTSGAGDATAGQVIRRDVPRLLE
ncbi:pilus assembly protein [Parasphingopyxis sp. CP4]|uniref:pilus assembly protein TadG-related protein n=1 Tax=Parasphingopyxis sp. CP4 TaxID=2724527 RepID=UPI0015A45ACC|nr:pilus assembly protein TadG-related protein [Parasphingopyxis sp. CP4]QLC22446.1 pilus assembly protein [Parasphingopyxis sp. CP4]